MTTSLVRVAYVHPETKEVLRVSKMKQAEDGSLPEIVRRRRDGRLHGELVRHHKDFNLPPPSSGLLPIIVLLEEAERCAPGWLMHDRDRVVKDKTERFEHPHQDQLDQDEADHTTAIAAMREYEAKVASGEVLPAVMPSTIEEIVQSRVQEELAKVDGVVRQAVERELAKRLSAPEGGERS